MRRALIALTFGLAGCASDPRDFAREPHMSPVGSGLSFARDDTQIPTSSIAPPSRGIALSENHTNLYRDVRAKMVGDVITISIVMDEKAVLGNSTGRQRNSKIKSTWAFLVDLVPSAFGLTTEPFNAEGNVSNEINANSSTQGQGSINRSEQIRLSIAAVVTDVLPNGNLIVQGSQEIRVNQELRVLNIAGIARPLDISKDNTISYDKIAEARIAYGGRGRLTEVQQPAWGHQAYDTVWPF